jgi:hypothetical protein
MLVLTLADFDRPLWTRGNDHRLRRASWVPFCLQITLLVLLVVLLIWFFLWPFVGLWWTTTTTTAPAISPAVVQPPITGDATAKLAQLEQVRTGRADAKLCLRCLFVFESCCCARSDIRC